MPRNLFYLVGGAVATVFIYNFWSFCCGRCTMRTFLTPGVPGGFLLFATVTAGAVLLVVRRRRQDLLSRRRCHCGAAMADDWRYCSECGGAARR
jgi:hypothetical protein